MTYQEKENKRRVLLGQGNNALITLIAIHLVLFLILAFIKLFFHLRFENVAQAQASFNDNMLSWFALSADTSKIGARPWTILSHMFVHTGFWSVFANMLWLWGFGHIMQDLTGNRKIFPVFFYGSLVGALAFVLAYNFLPSLKDQLPGAMTMGASAGIMSLAVATTMVAPGYRLFPMLNGGIPIWVITAVYIVIDLVTIPGNNPAIYSAHIAAAFTGFLFMYFFRQGFDAGEWINNFFDWFTNLFNPDKPKKGSNIKEELFYRSTTKPYRKTPNVTEQRVDEILDKISQKGYNALSEEEKDLLKRASQKDR